MISFGRPGCIGLGDQLAARVINEDRLPARLGLGDPLAQRVHLVGGGARRGGGLNQPPSGVVGQLLLPVIDFRAVASNVACALPQPAQVSFSKLDKLICLLQVLAYANR